MQSHSFRSIGRILLAACMVSLGVTSLSAQTAAPAAPGTPNASRWDVFMGYTYMGMHMINQPSTLRYSDIHLGAIGSVSYWMNRNFGGEVSYTNSPDGLNDGYSSIQVGPEFRKQTQELTLFAHGQIGVGRLGGPNNSSPSFFEHNRYVWGPVINGGGGVDYTSPLMNGRLGFRLMQVDYRYGHFNYGPVNPPPTAGDIGGRTNMRAITLSTGLLLHFGSLVPPPPVTASCSISAAAIFPGDPESASISAGALNPKMTATYSWTSDSGPVTGSSTTVTISTATLQPGTYTVKGHVSEGPKPGQSADCSAQFTVRAYEPPTIACSANPTSVRPGESSTITARGNSPQNLPLTYSYSATSGSVSGSGTSATLSTSGASPGTISITCNVVDSKGQSASARTSVSVIAPPPPPPVRAIPQTSSLCSMTFDRDKARPTRVDNEAKACMDDVALALQRSSDAKLAVVGNNSTPKTKAAQRREANYAAERAVNAKDYLVKEKGVDPSRVMVFTGSADTDNVSTTLVPAGATLNTAGLSPVDESAIKVQPRKAVIARKKAATK